MHGMYVCTAPSVGWWQPLVGPNFSKTLGEGPRLIPPNGGVPPYSLCRPRRKAEYTLASRMEIYGSLAVLVLLTRGEAETGESQICSLDALPPNCYRRPGSGNLLKANVDLQLKINKLKIFKSRGN